MGWPAWAVRARLAWARWATGAKRVLGRRGGVQIGEIVYRELTREPLTRALSKRGSGFKDYRVEFADGQEQVIRCCSSPILHVAPGDPPGAIYADLMGPAGLARLEPLLQVPEGKPGEPAPSAALLPGDRVLELGAGSGYRAVWLSFAVGPSGGVVALTHHKELAEYAQRRYSGTRTNIAFERAENFALSGETDGSFNAVVAMDVGLDASGASESAGTLLNELWRLVAAGGVLLLGAPVDEPTLKRLLVELLNIKPEQVEVTMSERPEDGGPLTDVLVIKGPEEPPELVEEDDEDPDDPPAQGTLP